MSSRHPPYSVMVSTACSELKERTGSSPEDIANYITDNYDVGEDMDRVQKLVRQNLKKGVASGALCVTRIAVCGSPYFLYRNVIM